MTKKVRRTMTFLKRHA